MSNQSSLSDIAKALYTVNRHAKTAPEPKHLYYIKKQTINKLLRQKQAEKVGLHFSDHPKLSNQHSTLLVKVENYYFHILPSKEDFDQLEHLGKLDHNYRNERVRMSLSHAKRVIYQYINWKHEKADNVNRRTRHHSTYYTPSSLGKWPPNKTYR